MSEPVRIDYRAPPTVWRLMRSDAFVRFIEGPFGSSKSSGCVSEILRRSLLQRPWVDGVRRTRWAVIRNTYGQLRDTSRKTFDDWVPEVLGAWREQEFTFVMNFPLPDGTRVESEVLFRALDRPQDVKKLLSLELTGAYINEAREVPKQIFDGLQGRVGRYPSRAKGGPSWFGVWADTNPPHVGHWIDKLEKSHPEGMEFYRQPSGLSTEAENVENLPAGYYERLCHGKDSEWVDCYVKGQRPASDVGSIWGAAIARLELAGGLAAFDVPLDEVFTSWDLGKNDSTAIWFWRLNGKGGVDVLDHYEAHGEGPDHYLDLVDSKPYSYAKIWLPHDAANDTLAADITFLSRCMKRWPGKVAITPSIALRDGIGAGRWLLEQSTRIHPRCDLASPSLGYSGLEALREYRFEWDEESRAYARTPRHDFASHSADAFRYLAVVVKFSGLMTRKRPEPADPLKPRPITLDRLWKEQEAQSRRKRI